MRITETIDFSFTKPELDKEKKKKKPKKEAQRLIKAIGEMFFTPKPVKTNTTPPPTSSPKTNSVEDAVIIGEADSSSVDSTLDEGAVSESELLEALFETAHSAKEAFECGWDTCWNPVTFEGFFDGIAAPKLKAGRLYKIFGPSPEEKRALCFLTQDGKPCVIAEVMPPGIGAVFELKELNENGELPSVSVERLKELLRKHCNIDYTEASV